MLKLEKMEALYDDKFKEILHWNIF